MRSPKPAASTIAVFGTAPAIRITPVPDAMYHSPSKAGTLPLYQAAERRQARDGRGRVADSAIRAACDGDIAACRRAGRAARKCRGSWWRAAPPWWRRAARRPRHRMRRRSPARRADIAREQLAFQSFRHVDARILQQRGDVIGGGADHGVLEIEQADARDALRAAAARSGSANGSRAAPRSAGRRAPAPAPRVHSARNSPRAVLVDRQSAMREIPVEQQFGLDQERRAGRRAGSCKSASPRSGSVGGNRLRMQRRQQVGGFRVARVDRRGRRRRTRRPRGRNPPAAESRVRDRRRRFPAPRSRAARRPSAIATNGFTSSARWAMAL